MDAPKILIIEESPAAAMRLKAILENKEYQVLDIVSFAAREAEITEEKMPELILIPILPGENIDNIDQAKKIASRYLINRIETERQLKQANIEIQSILSSMVTILIGVSAKDKITHWNKAAEKLFGISADEIIGQPIMMCKIKWAWERIYEGITETITEDVPVRLTDVQFTGLDGKEAFLEININALKESDGRLKGFLLTGEDITKRKQLEMQLVQAQKLESVGQLASGIAHEINTPTQYIIDNMHFVKDSIPGFGKLLKNNIELIDKIKRKENVGLTLKEMRNIIDTCELDYLANEIPKAVSQSLEGLMHVAKIVQSMKLFAHPDSRNKTQVDINKAIEDTVTISRNEWKYAADIERDFGEKLPLIFCYSGELNQVLLNIIINAAHAIEEKIKKHHGDKGLITISTRNDGNWIEIRIKDTGIGIPDEIKNKIYDPFFTTKEVGKGTGQGLAISYDIIVNKHKGSIDVISEVNKGAAFIIRLPVDNS